MGAVFGYFGTYTRTFLSMWELTIGNYASICNLLINDVSEWYGHGILLYKVTVGFAVVKVITGVFLHETFKTANTDDELMVLQKRRAQHKHKRKMQRFMREADADMDGNIQRGELREILADADVLTWLAAQGLEVADVDLLFELLDGGDGQISQGELTTGIARLKGPARSIDLFGLMHMTSFIQAHINELCTELDVIKTMITNAGFVPHRRS